MKEESRSRLLDREDALFVLWNGQRSRMEWCGGGGGVDRCPRQCPGVVNESRGMTDTPKPAASPSSSHPTAGPVGPTYITGSSPSNNFYTSLTLLAWTPAGALLRGKTNERRYVYRLWCNPPLVSPLTTCGMERHESR